MVRYVQGCMEEIWGKDINCAMLCAASWRGGNSGTQAYGGNEDFIGKCKFGFGNEC